MAKTIKRTRAKPIERLTLQFERDASGVRVHATGNGVKNFNLAPLFSAMQWIAENQGAAVALIEAFTQGRLMIFSRDCNCPNCVRAREMVASGEVKRTVQ